MRPEQNLYFFNEIQEGAFSTDRWATRKCYLEFLGPMKVKTGGTGTTFMSYVNVS